MHKIFFSLLLILLITTTAIAAGIRPVGGFATSNVCSSMSSSSPNILINDGFSSNLLFQGVNGVVSNGALANYGGPVTGSTLTQSAILGNVSGVNGTGSFSLSIPP